MPLGDTGSSPHLRGTQTDRLPGARRDRFIPAPAGNTHARGAPPPEKPVHPRTCGEHIANHIMTFFPHGSSPHLRGTPPRCRRAAHPARFIPAPAGNTSAPLMIAPMSPVHPRTCGEHALPPPLFVVNPGSSPHLRGTLNFYRGNADEERFIPAPAGNTKRSWGRHPR